jgi:hypothetical protein
VRFKAAVSCESILRAENEDARLRGHLVQKEGGWTFDLTRQDSLESYFFLAAVFLVAFFLAFALAFALGAALAFAFAFAFVFTLAFAFALVFTLAFALVATLAFAFFLALAMCYLQLRVSPRASIYTPK